MPPATVAFPVPPYTPSSVAPTWQQIFQVAGSTADEIAGLYIEVCADDERLAEGILAFARAHWLAASPTGSVATRILIHSRQPVADCPTESAQLALAQGTAHVVEQTIYIVIANHLLMIPAAGDLQIFLADAASPEIVSMLFAHALHAALRRHGWFELHAACAAEPVSAASFLFVGDSGCGKTTLAMRLAAQGWRYLTDDSLLLNEQLTAKPLRRVFALTPQTLAACAIPQITQTEKQALEPTQFFDSECLPETQPRHLVFPVLTHEAASEMVAISQAAALMRLLRQSPWACFDPLTGKQHLNLLTRLARASKAWELRAGRDLLEKPDSAARLLEKTLREEIRPN